MLQAGFFPRRAVKAVGSLLGGDNSLQTLIKPPATLIKPPEILIKLEATQSKSQQARMLQNEPQNEDWIQKRTSAQFSSPLICFLLQAASRETGRVGI